MNFKLLLTMAFSFLLVACSGDDGEPNIQSADAIPFTASICPETRLTTNNSWMGLSDAKVAVSMGGVVREYTVDEAGKLTSAIPFCWEGRTSVSVDAWYPYGSGIKPEVVVSSNQNVSSNYLKSDFLEVLGATVTLESAALVFLHRTAKVICTLIVPDGGMNGAQVILHGLRGVDEGNSVVMTGDYHALVAPQTVAAGVDFIEVIMNDKRTYVYKLAEDLVLRQGHICRIDLSFTPTGLDATINDSSTWTGNADDVDGSSSVDIPETGGGTWNGSIDGTAGSEDTGNAASDASASGQWSGNSDSVTAVENATAD